MGLSGILSLIALVGISATAFYYKDGIQTAFASTQKSDAEKEYDFERKQGEDKQWDESNWNPDNWFVYADSASSAKTIPKVSTKPNTAEYDPNTNPAKFNPPGIEYNADNPYGYSNTSERVTRYS